MIGSTVSHYRIVEKLGEGGMGVVYKAEDEVLHRPVALKFLAKSAIGDEEYRARFLREARAAAALDHPNICGIYEIGESGGEYFMAMPFLEGQSLDKRIRQGPLAIPDALEIAIQTGQALEEAHNKKIVHRDIKTANVMVRERGSRLHVTLMDFGLALLAQSTRITKEGAKLGTAAYMSPEQVQGSPADHRTDLWALGVVLYEMVIGILPFKSEYEQALFYSILNEQPEPMTALRSGLPMELERIVEKCLVKKPEERYQSATELLVDLTALKRRVEQEGSRVARSTVTPGPQATPRRPSDDAHPGTPFPASEPQRGSRTLQPGALILVAVVGLLAAGAGYWIGLSETPEQGFDPSSYVLSRVTLSEGVSANPAISPDGALIAYASDQADDGGGDLDIWVQQLNGGGAVRLTDNPASDYDPDFSPDSSRIVFRSDRAGSGIYTVASLGGEERLIAERGHQPRFSPDGRQIAYYTGQRNMAGPARLFLVAANGGTPRQILADFSSASCPIWLPDGKHLLFRGSRERRPPSFDWWVVSVDDETVVATGARDVFGLSQFELIACPDQFDAQTGDVVYSRRAGSDAHNIWRLHLSLDDYKVQGEPRRVTFGTGFDLQPALARDGRMAFFSASVRFNLWRLPVDHLRGSATAGISQFTRNVAYDNNPQSSADGTHLAYVSVRPGERSIWIRNLQTGEAHSVVDARSDYVSPILNYDGTQLAYASFEGPRQRAIYIVSTSGGALPRKVCQPCGMPRDWFRDGRRLLVQAFRGRPAIEVLDIETQKSYEVLSAEDAGVHLSRLSPDEKWIAFTHRIDANSSRVMIAPFRDGESTPESEWIAVTDGTAVDDDATWSPDGRRLYFRSDRSGFVGLYTRALNPATKQPTGDVQIVRDFRQITRSMGDLDPNLVSVAVTRDALIFPLAEWSGDVWLMQPRTATESDESE